jgi:transposase InsO family protein
VLVKFCYLTLKKPEKGVVCRYIMKVSGYSRQQTTRLIKQYKQTGLLKRQQKTSCGFPVKYTPEDVSLLGKLDELHGTLSGPATKKLCERAHEIFGQVEYQRLAGISVAHLYNLRNSKTYKRQRWNYEKTKPTISTIGKRAKPYPDGRPGFLRVDTVHQGDLDGHKGVYHINAVDEVTQFEVVYTVERISERFLIPALNEMLSAFPFEIKGFHSDNGSEYVNRQVAGLLHKLLAEFTKSRARHSNDNALAESKNGAIIRKILGYSHIPQHRASEVNEFNTHYLNPYINYHRPCFFPETVVDAKGKERKKYRYELMATPYEKFKSLENAESYLREGVSFQDLDRVATQITDCESARLLQKARADLFAKIEDDIWQPEVFQRAA